MPLQLVGQRLVSFAREEVHVLGQEETLCQALGNSTPFPLRPGSYTGCHWKGLITEPESGLQAHFWLRGGRHTRIDLGSWPSTTGRLSNHDPVRHSERWGGSIIRDPRLLFGSTLPFLRTAKRRGELGFYLAAVDVALRARHQVRNVQGSASALTPFLLRLDRLLLQMNLQTRLLLARLAELDFEVH